MSDRMSKREVISGLLWKLGERIGAQGVQFIVSIVLARLLTPEDYGYVGIVLVFISILMVFVQNGFGNALIQKKNATQTDFSSVFYVNVAVGVCLCVILQLIAPLIASFYDAEILKPVVRVLALGLILASINNVQNAFVARQMSFKKFFFATIIGTIVSAFTGIGAAFAGYGIWAIVIQQLTNQIIDTIILWITVKWRPSRTFSWKSIKELFTFGWKLLVSSLIDTIYNNLYSLTIGRYYSSADVGYYNRGKNIPNLVITNINSSIQAVMFPAYAKSQSNIQTVKAMVRKSMKVSTYLIFPIMVGLAATAKPLTIILLTEKWLPSVVFMQYCCFIYAFWPIHTANLQAISAIGRSDVYLKLEIAKKIIGVVTLIVTLPFGLHVMMIGRCINTAIASVINAIPNRKLLNYSIREQLSDLLPNIAISLFMGGVVYSIMLLNFNVGITLVLQIVVGIVVYLLASIIFKLDTFSYLLLTIKTITESKKK